MPKKADPKVVPFTHYPRASSFYAMSNCEASYQLSQASGEEPPTVFSDRGTDVHAVISGIVPPDRAEEGVSDEALMLLEQRDERLKQWGGDAALNIHPIGEKRLWIRDGLNPIYSGQPDSYVVMKKDVFLSDFKTGWHPLDDIVATNSQIRAYVPLIDQDLKHKIDSITAAIHKPGKLSPPALFDREAMDDAREWAVEVAIHAAEPGAKTPNRGPWCKYCAGKVLCPLWREELMSLSEMAAAVADEIPDTQLRSIAPKLELARTVIYRLESRLYERVKSRPEFFSDWSFEPGVSKRTIKDVIEAYNIMVVREKIMTAGEFLMCCRLTITDLETRVRKNKDLSTKTVTGFLNKIAEKVITKTEPKDKLVYDPKQIAGLDGANPELIE